MNLFHRTSSTERDKAVEAMFAENLSAQASAGRAAQAVARTSDQNRDRLHLLRREIARRTDAEQRARPSPPTSDVRNLVETALARVQPRPDTKG